MIMSALERYSSSHQSNEPEQAAALRHPAELNWNLGLLTSELRDLGETT